MENMDSQVGRWTGALLLGLFFLGMPVALSAQSSDDAVMRLECFDAAEYGSNEGFAIVVTQKSSDEYPADNFLPDRNGNYADRFPMFSNAGFFFSVLKRSRQQPDPATLSRLPQICSKTTKT